MARLTIALLAGGRSGEREVSLRSGEAVYLALDPAKYNVTRYDPRDDLARLIREREDIDLAFVLLHGKFGEDGRMQGFLDLLDIPFVGSGVLSSALSMNKKMAKGIYRRAGLTVAEDIVITRGTAIGADEIIEKLGEFLVVKPVAEGSSLGISLCRTKEALQKGIGLAFQHDREVMVEQYIKGTEVTGCVLGTTSLTALPLVEIRPSAEYAFFDYEAKYIPGATEEICPAPLPKDHTERAQSCAKAAHSALMCDVWSRTDMILKDEEIFILETNTIPGMTENSLVPRAARAAGMSLSDFVDRLIQLSLEKTQ
ncbi:MAG: D-alanine--D-alanine ligase [Deltaproteobacteria bacterium]|nr:D-alanine--D-alanine ligase [Deltaproteobacteria bacterium]